VSRIWENDGIYKRIRNDKLRNRITTPEKAVDFIKDGMVIGTSGFTLSGYPKAIPLELAKKNMKTYEKVKISLLTGASVGNELDGVLAQTGAITRRYPFQSNSYMRNEINSGTIMYHDIHLGCFPQQVRCGFFGHVDLAIIEAIAITEDGYIIPSTSVGATPTFADKADAIIVEINTGVPLQLEGIHDIYQPFEPPNCQVIPIIRPEDRIGTHFIPINPEKIKAIVITDAKDNMRSFSQDNLTDKIKEHLVEFLKSEVKRKRLPPNLYPIQSGVGNTANAVMAGLADSDFENMYVYSEVIHDSILDLMEKDKVNTASATSLTFSQKGWKKFYGSEKFIDKIILRPQDVSNNPEIIRRLRCIAINTAIEMDIYGNVNSTHLIGTKMMNGIGGSGDFARNAYLSIFISKSTAKNDCVSCIVPMVSHVDHTEHDVHVIITEHGVADLRGLAPRERAPLIIEKCADPDYRPMLWNYYIRAMRNGNHTPHLMDEALSWHVRYLETGSMKQ